MLGYPPSEGRCTASFFSMSAFGNDPGFLTIWDLETENEGLMEVKSGLHGLKYLTMFRRCTLLAKSIDFGT